jgi:hypothetical protein
MRRGLVFYNTRTIELACDRRHGARQQLVGGGLRMCRCWLLIFHGNRLVRTSSIMRFPCESLAKTEGQTQ